jgi:hypothetical protein
MLVQRRAKIYIYNYTCWDKWKLKEKEKFG